MKKLVLLKRDVMIWMGCILVLLCLSFGFGYFFGRLEQINLNKSLLQVIPDVNCGSAGRVDDQ